MNMALANVTADVGLIGASQSPEQIEQANYLGAHAADVRAQSALRNQEAQQNAQSMRDQQIMNDLQKQSIDPNTGAIDHQKLYKLMQTHDDISYGFKSKYGPDMAGEAQNEKFNGIINNGLGDIRGTYEKLKTIDPDKADNWYQKTVSAANDHLTIKKQLFNNVADVGATDWNSAKPLAHDSRMTPMQVVPLKAGGMGPDGNQQWVGPDGKPVLDPVTQKPVQPEMDKNTGEMLINKTNQQPYGLIGEFPYQGDPAGSLPLDIAARDFVDTYGTKEDKSKDKKLAIEQENADTKATNAKTLQFRAAHPAVKAGSAGLDFQKVKWTEDQWQKLAKFTDPLTQPSRLALGQSGTANVRAGRAIDLLTNKDITKDSYVYNLVNTDVQGVMKGATPDQEQLKEGYKTGQQQLAALWTKISSNPTAVNQPGVKSQLINILNGLRDIDNQVIDSQSGVAKVAFEGAIKNNPDRAIRFFQSLQGVKAAGAGPSGSAPAASDKSGVIKYTRDPKTGKLVRE